MKQIEVRIKGTCPMLMHSDRTANPLDYYAKELKKRTSKRQKTEDDHAEISRIEFEAGLYYRDGYYMPAANLEAVMIASAKHNKKGVLIKQAMLIPEDGTFEFPDQSLTPEKLFKKDQYVDMRTVKVQQAKNIRTRPIFNEWECKFTVYLDPNKMEGEDFKAIVVNAGRYCGLGDYRPRYGRFELVTFKIK